MNKDTKDINIKHAAIVPLAGGFALGATKFIGKVPEVIFSYKNFYDNDKLYLRYLQSHNTPVPYYQIDNEYFDIKDIHEKYKDKIDYAHSIFPCSGLSMCSQLKPGTRTDADPNKWMLMGSSFMLENVSPKVFIFENAPALCTHAGAGVRDKLYRIARDFGYSITFYKTNTLNHGVPQFRPRTFAIFLKGDNAPILNYYNKAYIPLAEYLNSIPESASLQKKYMTDDYNISEYEITKYFKKIYGEDKWRSAIYKLYKTHLTSYDFLKRQNLLLDFKNFVQTLPDASPIVKKDIDHVIKKTSMNKNFRLSYRVLGMDRDYTYAVISEMMCRTIHPTKDRLLNIREHMTLMGLPFDYELESPKEYPKITQNVPVATCRDITNEAVEIISGNRSLAATSLYMQDNTKQNINFKTKTLF